MRLNKILLLLILTLLETYKVYAGEIKKEYVFLDWVCSYSGDRSLNNMDLKGPCIYTQYNKKIKKDEIVFYTKEECLNKLKKELLDNVIGISEYRNDNYYRYIGGGLYQLDFGYYRYACAKHKDIRNYISKKYEDCSDQSKLPKEFFEKCPPMVDENNFQIFNNIFPLDKDEKESIEFTKKFDEGIREKIKIEIKKSKEEQRRERLEEQRKKNSKDDLELYLHKQTINSSTK